MTQKLLFRHKQLNKFKKRLQGNLAAFFLLFFITGSSVGQITGTGTMDTVSIAQYQYVTLHTNNGSQCICLIKNTNAGQLAKVTNTGDTNSSQFDDTTSFNGIHTLQAEEQIIAVADFKGSQLIVTNTTSYPIIILVGILCPQN